MKKIVSLFFVSCLSIILTSCTGEPRIGGLGDSGINFAPYPEIRETYNAIEQNSFHSTEEVDSQSFSLKVDTAAYTNVVRYLRKGILPPKDAVRTE